MRDRNDRALAASAATCAALVFAVVASSAWLRLAPGSACPAGGCEGFALADGVRLAHRVAAMAVSVVTLLIAWLAWARRPASWGLRATALVILVLVAALAALGRSSSGTPSAPVALGNLLGGMVLLGLCAGLAFSNALAASPQPGHLHAPTAAATALVAAGIVTGGLLAVTSPEPPRALHAAHLAIGWILPIAWAALAGRTSAATPGRCRFILAALLAVVATALATLGPDRSASPFAAWLHNGIAAATLCAALAALARSRRPT